MTYVKYDSQLVDTLSTHFPKRSDPLYIAGQIIPTCLMFGKLRGLWPMSSCNKLSDAYDISGQGRVLKAVIPANVRYSFENLIPFVSFSQSPAALNGVMDTDSLSYYPYTITVSPYGSAYHASFYCWFRPKFTGVLTPYFSWLCRLQKRDSDILTDTITYGVSLYSSLTHHGVIGHMTGPGWSMETQALDSTMSASDWANRWHFCAMRLNNASPTASLDVFFNGVWFKNSLPYQGIILDPSLGPAPAFYLGRKYIDGQLSLSGLHIGYLGDALIQSLWDQSRILYGR